MDQRCAACEIKGGDEKPCVSESLLRLIEAETKGARPCPRIEPDPALAPVEAMLPYIVREDLRQLAPVAFARLTADWDREDVDQLLRLIPTVLGLEDVSRQLYLSPAELARLEREEATKAAR